MNRIHPQPYSHIARLMQLICDRFRALPESQAETVQMFYETKLSLGQIADIQGRSLQEVRDDILVFSEGIMAQDSELPPWLRSLPKAVEKSDNTCRAQAKALIDTCENPEAIGATFRELVGTAIRFDIPAEPQTLFDQIVARISTSRGQSRARTFRLVALLENEEFCLRRILDEAAGDAGQRDTMGNPSKTRRLSGEDSLELPFSVHDYSSGFVTLEHERISFQISIWDSSVPEHKEAFEQRLNQHGDEGFPRALYQMEFDNLPLKVVPVALCYRGLDRFGEDRLFELPIRNIALIDQTPKWILWVDSQEQQDAYVGRSGDVEIAFVVSSEHENR